MQQFDNYFCNCYRHRTHRNSCVVSGFGLQNNGSTLFVLQNRDNFLLHNPTAVSDKSSLTLATHGKGIEQCNFFGFIISMLNFDAS